MKRQRWGLLRCVVGRASVLAPVLPHLTVALACAAPRSAPRIIHRLSGTPALNLLTIALGHVGRTPTWSRLRAVSALGGAAPGSVWGR